MPVPLSLVGMKNPILRTLTGPTQLFSRSKGSASLAEKMSSSVSTTEKKIKRFISFSVKLMFFFQAPNQILLYIGTCGIINTRVPMMTSPELSSMDSVTQLLIPSGGWIVRHQQMHQLR